MGHIGAIGKDASFRALGSTNQFTVRAISNRIKTVTKTLDCNINLRIKFGKFVADPK